VKSFSASGRAVGLKNNVCNRTEISSTTMHQQHAFANLHQLRRNNSTLRREVILVAAKKKKAGKKKK